MFILNNLKFNPNSTHIIDETQYPAGWFLDPDNRAAVGIIEVPDPVYPDPELFSYAENPDGTLTVTPLDPEVIAARAASAAVMAREEAVAEVIRKDTVVNQLKDMTNAEFDTWWAANVTNAAQAIGVLKRITRMVILNRR